MRKFSRKTNRVVALVGVFLGILFGGIAIRIAMLGSEDATQYVIAAYITLIVTAIVTSVLPSDFGYYIRCDGEFFIFEFSSEDVRPIKRKYTVVKKTWKEIVLTDGIARIKIAYNNKVLEFLKQNQQ